MESKCAELQLVDFHPTFYRDPTACSSDQIVTYLVALAVDHPEIDDIWPEYETPVTLEVTIPGRAKTITFVGTVCEDVLEEGCAICLAVQGEYHDFTGNALWKSFFRATMKYHSLEDPTSAHRGLLAFRRLSEGHSGRKLGVDLRDLCFGAPTPGHNPSIEHLLSDRLLARLGQVSPPPTEDQLSIVHSFFRSSTSVMLLQGATGTGKTYTAALIVIACLALGYKVLITAPSKDPVKVALDTLKDCISDEEALKSQLVPFNGASSTLKRLPSLDTTPATATTQQLDEHPSLQPRNLVHTLIACAVATYMQMKMPKDFRDSYSAKLQTLVDAAMNDPNDSSTFRNLSVDYIVRRTDVYKHRWTSPHERLEMIKGLFEAEQALHKEYFGKHAKVVFTTCSLSYHPVLRQQFKPNIIIIEEAATGTPADIRTPLAAFKDTVKMVFQTGDHRQTKPLLSSQHANEMFNMMFSFRNLMINPWGEWTKSMLDSQFRMHPHISDWPATQFYSQHDEKLLRNASGVAKQDMALQITLKEMFQQLGPAWNGRFRVAIDVSGKDTSSKPWINTSSLHNTEEAHTTLKLVRFMINYEPKDPKARKIVPNDIYMISPYRGQRDYIYHVLVKCNTELDRQLAERIMITPEMQGRSAPIVFIMHTENISISPRILRYCSKPETLNINSTRARNMFTWVGNWMGWCKAMYESQEPENKHFLNNPVMESLVRHVLDKQDVVSSTDMDAVFGSDGVMPASSTFKNALGKLREEVQAKAKDRRENPPTDAEIWEHIRALASKWDNEKDDDLNWTSIG